MDRPVVEPNTTVVIAPAEGVLEPIFVVSRRKIFPGMGSATLRPPNSGRCRRDLCWNLIGAVSDWMRIRGQAARSIGLSASFWVRLCHPSTLRIAPS
jgi:hypothetical protein